MTAIERVRSTQRALGLATGTAALLWAITALLAGLSIVIVLNRVVTISAQAGRALVLTMIGAALFTLAALLWRGRFVWSIDRVALWIEERVPKLRYALVTAIDPRYAGSAAPELQRAVDQADTGPHVKRAFGRSVGSALIAFVVVTSGFIAFPAEWRAGLTGIPLLGVGGSGAAMKSRLETLRGTVTPPPYAVAVGVEGQKLREPSSIQGLTGSRVMITGHGEPQGLDVTLGDRRIESAGGEDGWTVSFALPDSAMLLRLVDRQYRRLIVIDPRPDEPPGARLLLPVHDTTLRTISGSITLNADLTDDYGISRAMYDYIVTTGENEGEFKFRQGIVTSRSFAQPKSAKFGITVPLEFFALQEGDQLQLRAVVIDNNTLSGPDTGYSETRTVRIARKGEYDSLAVEGAPPPDDSTMTSLRDLIRQTEELNAQKARMPRDTFIVKANKIGDAVRRIIYKVDAIQLDYTLGGVFPESPLLRTAREELWEAARSLFITETAEALPHMWTALRALQKFALAKRYYLRGKTPPVLVNLDRVRLTGTDTGYAKSRQARDDAEADRPRLRREFAGAVRALRASPDSALELLAIMQVTALRQNPRLGAALGELVETVRAKKDPSTAISRVRRAIDGAAIVSDSLRAWSGIW